MRILVAPDSFKGSLSAFDVATAIGAGMTGRHDVTLLPLADGGEGSVEAALAAGAGAFERRSARVRDARGRLHDAPYAFGPAGLRTGLRAGGHASERAAPTAVVEIAATCGLPTLHGPLAPLTSSSRGLGDALLDARAAGAGRIVLALGGSASTDGGMGILGALGVRFLDADGEVVAEGARGLPRIRRVDASRLTDLSDTELIAATDVQSILTGVAGAAAVFGPQKGLAPGAVARTDAALTALVPLLTDAGFTGAAEASVAAGSGAAGGAGFALLLLGARVVSGADHFLDLLEFDARARASDLVVTGEGRLDSQTAAGKLVTVVARRAGATPVVAVVGRSDLDEASWRRLGLSDVYALTGRSSGDTAADPELTRQLLADIGREIASRAERGR